MAIQELPRVAQNIPRSVAPRARLSAWAASVAPLSCRDKAIIGQQPKPKPISARRHRQGSQSFFKLIVFSSGSITGALVGTLAILLGIPLVGSGILGAGSMLGVFLLGASSDHIGKAAKWAANTTWTIARHPAPHITTAVLSGAIIFFGALTPFTATVGGVSLVLAILTAKLRWFPKKNDEHTVILHGKLGDYNYDPNPIDGSLGKGGMASLYLGTKQGNGGTQVVLKIMSPEAITGGDARRPTAQMQSDIDRFKDEENILVQAHAAYQLLSGEEHCPNIVIAIDGGNTGQKVQGLNQPFIVLEYISGKTLSQQVLGRGTYNAPSAVNISLQVLNGLAAFHIPKHASGSNPRAGVTIHRDLTPRNIMLVDEAGNTRAIIIDPGIAKQMDVIKTRAGDVMGAWHFLPPETAERADERSDLFQLGLGYFYMRTGNHATASIYQGASDDAQKMERLVDWRRSPTPFSFDGITNPNELHFLQKACHPDPNLRYQNINEMRADLEKLQRGEEIPDYFAPPPPPPRVEITVALLRSIQRDTHTLDTNQLEQVYQGLRAWKNANPGNDALVGIVSRKLLL